MRASAWLGIGVSAALAACGSTATNDGVFGGAGGAGAGNTGSGASTTGSGAGTTGTTTVTNTFPCEANDPCASCTFEACPDVYCNCVSNPSCTELIACATSCTEPGCQQACLTKYEDSIALAVLFADCSATSCKSVCMATGEPLPPCEHCLFTSCAPQANACFANPQCGGYIDCMKKCDPGDMGCGAQCEQDFAGGVPDAQSLFTCAQQACGQVCN